MKTSIALTPAPLSRVPFLYAGRLDTGLRRAAELGYDAVELHLRDPAAEDMASIAKSLRDLGLAVSSFGTGQGATVDGLTISSPDPACRESALRRLFSHVDAAAAFGACVIVGSMQGRLDADRDVRDGQTAAAVEVLKRVADRAAARGVRVAVEPLNRYETNFNNTVSDALGVLERVGNPALCLLLDTFHMNIEESSLPRAIAAAGRHIGLVHLADSNRGAAGTGHTDFASVVEALRDAGFGGYLSAEILPMGDDDAAARTSIETMRALLASGRPKR
jgi:sugar phosphate isomerase/epimerase